MTDDQKVALVTEWRKWRNEAAGRVIFTPGSELDCYERWRDKPRLFDSIPNGIREQISKCVIRPKVTERIDWCVVSHFNGGVAYRLAAEREMKMLADAMQDAGVSGELVCPDCDGRVYVDSTMSLKKYCPRCSSSGWIPNPIIAHCCQQLHFDSCWLLKLILGGSK